MIECAGKRVRGCGVDRTAKSSTGKFGVDKNADV